MEHTEEGTERSEKIIEHVKQPKNYGKLEDADGVGIGFDEKSGEYVILYVATEEEQLTDIAFATNGCQNTVVMGSAFTEMVKGVSTEHARKIVETIKEKVASAPASQQACSDLVLTAFDAALIHRERKMAGSEEEMCSMEINGSCDPSETA